VLILALLLLIGLMLAVCLFTATSPLEKAAYALLFALTAVPFVVINFAVLTARPIGPSTVFVTAALAFAALAWPTVRRLRQFARPKLTAGEIVAAGVALAVAVFSWFYYTNSEFLLSLASYLQRGEAKCFYMLTFKLLAALNPDGPLPLKQIYGIISTPGNAMFTATLVPALGEQTFRVLYAFFQLALFLFTYLLVVNWTGRVWLGLAAALFATLNPYALSVEVLDRNNMALALSAALFYTVFRFPTKTLLHGLLWGVTAGVGLRFLPLTFALPILVCYGLEKARPKAYAFFLLGFAVAFPFNIPHLFDNGFASIGEATPPWTLLGQALAGQWRTPFAPYPNYLLYPINALNHFGYLLAALIVLGLVEMARTERRRLLLLGLLFLPTYVVLAAQRNWLEQDKLRILLTAFLPLAVWAAYGLRALADRKRLAWNVGTLAITAIALFGSMQLLKNYATPVETGTYDRKLLYQRDTAEYHHFYRRAFAAVPWTPHYGRLWFKLDLSRKAEEERNVRSTLFASDGTTPPTTNARVNDWFAARPAQRIVERPYGATFKNLRLDLEKLVTQPDAAVSLVEAAPDVFVDLENKKDLLDFYFKAAPVTWQKEKLPLAVMIGKPELASLRELYLDLNAFVGFGRDEDGFERVNVVNLMLKPERRDAGLRTGLTALPQFDERPEIILRVPTDITVIVRNWLIDGENGSPHRIDSWRIRFTPDGQPRADFFYLEPESYL
jgi:hypothetical protein